MNIKLRVNSLFLLILLFPILGMATPKQHQSKSISLTPFIGIHSGFEFGKLIPLPNTSDVPEIKIFLDPGNVMVGMSLGYFLTKHFEFQGTFSYGQAKIMNDIGIGFAGIPLGKVKVSDAKTFLYSGSILYHILFRKFSLYLSTGLGGITLKPDRLNNRTRLLLNFGIGIKAKIIKHIYPVLDIRDYVSFFNYAEDFNIVYIAIYNPNFKQSQHHFGIQVGLSFLF